MLFRLFELLWLLGFLSTTVLLVCDVIRHRRVTDLIRTMPFPVKLVVLLFGWMVILPAQLIARKDIVTRAAVDA